MQAKYIFILLFFLVLFMQYDLLKPTLRIGLTPDDWSFIFWYKLLGPNPWLKFFDEWAIRGPYTTVPLFYTGFINSLVGFDFFKQQLISIFFKTLATLVLFPLILLIFKNKLLAFFTTIIFAMSYQSTGALETAVEPSEYLGMFFMGVFLMVYFWVIKKKTMNWQWLLLIMLLLLVTILMSVMRTYPLLVLIPLIELYLLIIEPSKKVLKQSFLRLIILFLPFILLTLFRPGVILAYIGNTPVVVNRVLEGNVHLILTPIQGLGATLPIGDNLWRFFGVVDLNNFYAYLSFLMGGPLVVFGLIILLLGLLTCKNPFKFMLIAFTLNLFLQIVVYLIATYYLSVPVEDKFIFEPLRMYSTLFGLFILSLAVVYWIDSVYIHLWVGPLISFLFIVLTWILASENLSFGGAQDHYLLIPEAGTSLFIAGILTILYKRLQFKKRVLYPLSYLVILAVLVTFYILNRDLIYTYFNRANDNGRAADGQIYIQSKFREKIKDIDLSKPALFYFDTSELSGNGPYYTEGLLSPFPVIMHFQGEKIIQGCFENYYASLDKLSMLIQERDGEKGFVYRSLCVKNGKGYMDLLHYKMENFYAFKIKNDEFIDIKMETLEKLGF